MIMKNKFMLPLLAILFALAGAIASPVLSQSGWYDVDGTGPNAPVFGTITTPGDTPTCGSSGDRICKVGSSFAYSTAAGATNSDETKLLKYTMPE
jgi:hypothetical protein